MSPNKAYVCNVVGHMGHSIYTPNFRNFAKKLQLLIIHVLTCATILSLFQAPSSLDLVGYFLKDFHVV